MKKEIKFLGRLILVMFIILVMLICFSSCQDNGKKIFKCHYITKYDVAYYPNDYKMFFEVGIGNPDTLQAITSLFNNHNMFKENISRLDINHPTVINMTKVHYTNDFGGWDKYYFTFSYNLWWKNSKTVTCFYPKETSVNIENTKKEVLINEINRLGGLDKLDTIYITYEGIQQGWE